MATLSLSGRYYSFYPPDKPAYMVEPLQLDTSRTAFLLVDVYGPDPSPSEEHRLRSWDGVAGGEVVVRSIVAEHIRPATDAARRIGLPIIYVNNSAPRIEIGRSELGKQSMRVTHQDYEQFASEDTVDPREYVFGHDGAVGFSKTIEPQPGDYFIRKHMPSGFFETRLDGLLRNLGIKTLICVGFSLCFCLHCTMIDAWQRNYQVVLLRDCAMALELPEELPTLSFTKRMVTWTESALGHSITSEEFIAACDRLASPS